MHFTSGSASLGHYEHSMRESQRPNDSCSLNRSETGKRNKRGELQLSSFYRKIISRFLSWVVLQVFPISLFFLLSFFHFLPVCSDLPWASFDTPWQWLWSINHLFPELSVPACSEMKQQPLDHRHRRFQPFSARLSCQPPPPHHTPNNRTLLWCCTDISNHLVCFQAKYR